MRRVLLGILGVLGAAAAPADERWSVDGLLDLRAVHAEGPPGYLYGGVNTVRFDSDHEGLRLGRASVDGRVQITDTVSASTVVDAYDDGDMNAVGVSEAFILWRPFPGNALRWRVKAGAFFLPASLEHRLAGWASPYTLSASSVNTWLGEEFRVLGTEIEARWLGASSGYRGDVGVSVGVFGWNEGAGVILADRGWALTDRPSLLFGHLGVQEYDLYYEVDRRPGAYAGLSWRHHERLEVRALRYDNRADPAAHNLGGDHQAWHTQFTTIGARWEPLDWLALLAQRLEGMTSIGPNGSDGQFRMQYAAWYALASAEHGHERFSIRYDHLSTEQLSGFYGPLANEAGHALTAAWMHRLADHWELDAEWLRVVSDYPPRLAAGFAAAETDTQVQLAIRYRFRLE